MPELKKRFGYPQANQIHKKENRARQTAKKTHVIKAARSKPKSLHCCHNPRIFSVIKVLIMALSLANKLFNRNIMHFGDFLKTAPLDMGFCHRRNVAKSRL